LQQTGKESDVRKLEVMTGIELFADGGIA